MGMKRIYLLVPLFASTLFAGYYHHWNTNASFEVISHKCLGEHPDEYSQRDGRRDAKLAIARGQLIVLTYGRQTHWSPEYGEVLARDYGIQLHAVAGCRVTTPLLNYVRSYDEIMERHITATLGKGVFDDAEIKAKNLFAERQPNSAKPSTEPIPGAPDF